MNQRGMIKPIFSDSLHPVEMLFHHSIFVRLGKQIRCRCATKFFAGVTKHVAKCLINIFEVIILCDVDTIPGIFNHFEEKLQIRRKMFVFRTILFHLIQKLITFSFNEVKILTNFHSEENK